MKMKFCKVRDVKTPVRGTAKSAGLDFFVPNDLNKTITLAPGQDALIPSGIKAELPKNYMLMAADKSGIATSFQACRLAGKEPKESNLATCLIVGAKIVDEDFQGEIHIHVINVGADRVTIKPGMKLAQFILVPVLYAELEEVAECNLFAEVSERGEGSFGSTN